MSIKLSKKHGVNPSLDICIYCGESKGIILYGRLKNDEEAPRQIVSSPEPCGECRNVMNEQNGVAIFGKKTEHSISGVIISAVAFRRIFEQEPPLDGIAQTDIQIIEMFQDAVKEEENDKH